MYKVHFAGGVFLRRKGFNVLGLAALSAGVVIILSIVLPSSFWWFALAAALICAGVWLIRCC